MTVKSRADILAEIATLLADNTTKDISEQDVRTVFEDVADSCLNETSDGTFANLTFPATVGSIATNGSPANTPILGSNYGIARMDTNKVAIVENQGRIAQMEWLPGSSAWQQNGNLSSNLGGQSNVSLAALNTTQVVWAASNYVYKHTFADPNWSGFTVGTISGAGDVAITNLTSTEIAWINPAATNRGLRRYDVSGGAASMSLVGSGLDISGLVQPDICGLDANNIAMIDTGIGTLRTYQDAGGGSWSQVGTPLAISGMSGKVVINAIDSTTVMMFDDGNEEIRIYENGPNWTLSSITPYSVPSSGNDGFDLTMISPTLLAYIDEATDQIQAYDVDLGGASNPAQVFAGDISAPNLSGTNTGDEISATETVEGVVERATDAEAAAGTDTTRYITPKQLIDNAGAPTFITADLAIVPAGPILIGHGLTNPTQTDVTLVNVTAEHGWSTGDVVALNGMPQTNNNDQGIAVWLDGTNVNARYGSGSGAGTPVFEVMDKTAGTYSTITNANWKIRIKVTQ